MSKRGRAGRANRGLGASQRPDRAATTQAAAVPAGQASSSRSTWTGAIAASGVAIAMFALYLVTLAPTVATGDSGELATVAATLGLAHPPGYPTFTLLGHLFTWLPIGDAAYRVNLMSAAMDATAVLVACLIVGRLIDAAGREAGTTDGPPSHAWLAAAVGGLSLAISTAFWRYSLVAEVFALSNLLALLVLLLMLEWSRRPERMRILWAAALVSGLALTNQQTIVFAAPALVVLLGLGLQRYAAASGPRSVGRPVPWRALGIALLVGVVGLLPYLYLPLAAAGGAAKVWGDPTTLGGFVAILTRSAYGTFAFTVRDTSGSPLEHLALFGGYLVTAFTPVGLAIAAAGAGWLALRRTGEALALGLWFLITGPLFLVIANPPLSDPITRGVLERFYLLPSLVVAVAVGVGAWQVAGWVGRRAPFGASIRPWVATTAAAAMIVALAALAVVRLPELDESGNRVAERYADDLLGPLPRNTLLLMRSDENYTSVTYAQEVRGFRRDVIAVDVELLKIPSYVDLVEARHPEVDVPFYQYDGGIHTFLADLIAGEIDLRPIFVTGEFEEDFGKRFDLLDQGLADQVLPDGQAPDRLAALRVDPGLGDRLHPPDRTYPETAWEAAIAAHYADVAFQTGVALQTPEPQTNAAEVERFYRDAIRISPTIAGAYKNLGVLLQANGGSPEEIISVWERYLELRPDDPQAGAIRSALERLRSGASPAP